MIATAAGFEWLKATLTADTGAGGFMTLITGLFRDLAPAGQLTPYAIMQAQSAPRDVLTSDIFRTFSDGLFVVKVVGKSETDYATQIAAYKRADTLLARTSGSAPIAGASILSCYRENEIALSENVDGVIFSHLGGVYRLLIQ